MCCEHQKNKFSFLRILQSINIKRNCLSNSFILEKHQNCQPKYLFEINKKKIDLVFIIFYLNRNV